MKQLPVDLDELALAFENASYEMSYYLDLETGETVLVTQEISSQLEGLYDRAYEQNPDLDPEAEIDLPALLAQERIVGWQVNALLDAGGWSRGSACAICACRRPTRGWLPRYGSLYRHGPGRAPAGTPGARDPGSGRVPLL